MKRVSAVVSVVLHGAVGVALARTHARPAPVPQVRVQVAVVEKALPPPVPAAAPAPEVHPVRMARAAHSTRASAPARAPSPAPPPPTVEAARPSPEDPVVIAGITLESTSASGSFAVAAGNTLAAAPERIAPHLVKASKPYKAAQYAPATDLAEMPEVLNRNAVDIRRYYPKDALQRGIEGEVILRLTIDADGSIADATVVKDPGQGMGPAALRAVREFRFAPGKAGGAPVATSIPFVIRFVIT